MMVERIIERRNEVGRELFQPVRGWWVSGIWEMETDDAYYVVRRADARKNENGLAVNSLSPPGT